MAQSGSVSWRRLVVMASGAAGAALIGAAAVALAAHDLPLGGAACAPIAEVQRELEAQFQERAVGSGVVGGDASMVLFMSRDSGSWTMMRVTPDGVACLVAYGTSWRWLGGQRA